MMGDDGASYGSPPAGGRGEEGTPLEQQCDHSAGAGDAKLHSLPATMPVPHRRLIMTLDVAAGQQLGAGAESPPPAGFHIRQVATPACRV